MYRSERILCPIANSELSEIELMEQYGRFFGEEPWVTFSGCPAITLTQAGESNSGSLPKGKEVLSIATGCYIESSHLPAFPSCPTKITSVSVNNRPFGKITIGKGCVMQGTSICAYESISIGDNVIFGPNVVVMDCSGHALTNRGCPDELDRLKSAPITIGNDVWIGYGSIILPGVNIGEGAVIGAGSVVSRDIPTQSMAAGNPCHVMKTTLEDE